VWLIQWLLTADRIELVLWLIMSIFLKAAGFIQCYALLVAPADIGCDCNLFTKLAAD